MTDTDQSILITGATDFVGSYILRLLLKKGYHRLYATHSANSTFDLLSEVKQHVHWIEWDPDGDILFGDDLPELDVIIHTATLISFYKSDRAKLFQLNIEGTSSVVDFALAADVKRFIHISTAAALGGGSDKLIDESTPWVDHTELSDYAVSMQYAEREVYRGMMEGLEAVILSPAMVLGGGYWDQQPLSLFGLIYNGVAYYPKGSTGIVDVRDVAQMASLMIDDDDYLGQKIILSAEQMSLKSIFELIASALSVSPPSKPLSSASATLARYYDFFKAKWTAQERIITKQSIAIAQHNYRYDNSRSKSVDKFSYRPIRESIVETSQAWLNSHKVGQSFQTLKI